MAKAKLSKGAVTCFLCNQEVKCLKSGSHIMPRWVMVKTKTRGRNIHLSRETAKKNQTDDITEAWCQKCEDEFTELDAVGALFFRDRKYFSQIMSLRHPSLEKPLRIELHSKKDFEKVKRFALSICVRYFLADKVKDNKLKYNKFFINLVKIYRNKQPVFLAIDYFENLSGVVFGPEILYRDKKCISIMILGYRIYLYTSEASLPTYYVTDHFGDDVPALISSDFETKLFSDISEMAKKHKDKIKI